MSYREEVPAWLEQLERCYPSAAAWMRRFLRVYQFADESEQELLQGSLAMLERELIIQAALRSPARHN